MEKLVFEIVTAPLTGQMPMTMLQVHGELNYSNYRDLTDIARKIYEGGQRNLLLDTHDMSGLGLAGLFALYSVAMIFRGEIPLEPEGGSAALYMMAEHIQLNPSPHFRLFSPPAHLEQVLRQNGFEVYPDLPTALASMS